jgi:hypothetical protein
MHYRVADIVTLRITTQNCDTYTALFLCNPDVFLVL